MMDGRSVPGRLSWILLAIVAFQALISARQQDGFEAAFSLGIAATVVVSFRLAYWRGLYIPPGLQLMLVAVVFAWFFLGYVHSYYDRFSWWDTALHIAVSAAISVIAFLLVHIFNRCDEFGSRTRPGLTALFAFVFSVAIGALWEVFEFLADATFGFNMQKPMWGDASGLTDTMADLTADTTGSFGVAVYGYYHLKRRHKTSVLKHWVDSFIQGNPRLFGRVQ